MALSATQTPSTSRARAPGLIGLSTRPVPQLIKTVCATHDADLEVADGEVELPVYTVEAETPGQDFTHREEGLA